MQQNTKGTNLFGKIFGLIFIGLLLSSLQGYTNGQWRSHIRESLRVFSKIQLYFEGKQPQSPLLPNYFPSVAGTPPLVMEGGDPYIRALMRTITASEANVSKPYNVIYGGQFIEDLSQHPEICVTIVAGPNKGNCSTAAGRYQILNFTWHEKAQRYHPDPSGFWRWRTYSFAAEYQDRVVHDWLSDRSSWAVDIPQLLRDGEQIQVFQLLSGTWTSLGYGIETNSMTKYLPTVYQNMLQEELNS
ncbi:MAG: glycoside hydrolase [Pleurocapsa sp.]